MSKEHIWANMTTTASPWANGSIQSAIAEMETLKKQYGTSYGPAVMTISEVTEFESRYSMRLAGPPYTMYGMEVVEVATRDDVMPMVRELRRRGKRPVFVGMITK